MGSVYFDDKVYNRFARTRQPPFSATSENPATGRKPTNQTHSASTPSAATIVVNENRSTGDNRPYSIKSTRNLNATTIGNGFNGSEVRNGSSNSSRRPAPHSTRVKSAIASQNTTNRPCSREKGESSNMLRQRALELGPDVERRQSHASTSHRPNTTNKAEGRPPVNLPGNRESKRPKTNLSGVRSLVDPTLQRNLALYSKAVQHHASSESHEPTRLKDTQQGEVEIKLQVQDIDVATSEDEDLVSILSTKVLSLYEFVTERETHYLERLNNSTPFQGIVYKRIRIGSIILVARCDTLHALNELEKRYQSGELNSHLNDVLINGEVLETIGVNSLELNASVRSRNLAVCRSQLLAKEMLGKRNANKTAEEAELFVSRIDCVRKLHEVGEDFCCQHTAITNHYNYFLSYINDFFMVLKLSKPVELKTFVCLEDISACYRMLVQSQSIGKSVRMDLVHDFLSIIESVRSAIQNAFIEINAWQRHLFRYISQNDLDQFERAVEDANLLLSPQRNFNDLGNLVVIKVNILDRQIFGGVIKYIPALLASLARVEKEIFALADMINYGQGNPDGLEETIQEAPSVDFQSQETINEIVKIVLSKSSKQVTFAIQNKNTEKPLTSPGESRKQEIKANKKQSSKTIGSVPNTQTQGKNIKGQTSKQQMGKSPESSESKRKQPQLNGFISKLANTRKDSEGSENSTGSQTEKEKTPFPQVHGRAIVAQPAAEPPKTVETNGTIKEQQTELSITPQGDTSCPTYVHPADQTDETKLQKSDKLDIQKQREQDNGSVSSNYTAVESHLCSIYDIQEERKLRRSSQQKQGEKLKEKQQNTEYANIFTLSPSSSINRHPQYKHCINHFPSKGDGSKLPSLPCTPRSSFSSSSSRMTHSSDHEIGCETKLEECENDRDSFPVLATEDNSYQEILVPCPEPIDNGTSKDGVEDDSAKEDVVAEAPSAQIDNHMVSTRSRGMRELQQGLKALTPRSQSLPPYRLGGTRSAHYNTRNSDQMTALKDISLEGFGLLTPQNTPTSSMLLNNYKPSSSSQKENKPRPVTAHVDGNHGNNTTANKAREKIVTMASSMKESKTQLIHSPIRALKSAHTERYREKNFSDVIKSNQGLRSFLRSEHRTDDTRAKSETRLKRGLNSTSLTRLPPEKRTNTTTVNLSIENFHHATDRSSLTRSMPRLSADPISAVHYGNRPADTNRRASQIAALLTPDSARFPSSRRESLASPSFSPSRRLSSTSKTSLVSEEDGRGYSPYLKVFIRTTPRRKKEQADRTNNYEYTAFSNLVKAVSQR